MNNIPKVIAFCILSLIPLYIESQDNDPIWEVDGYVKFLQNNFHSQNPGMLITGQLVHHRINLTYITASRKFQWNTSLRNRLFYGELIKFYPQLSASIDEDANDYLDLGITYLKRDASLAHSVLDRFYVEYLGNKIEWRLGRQRINWGIQTIWNPNDIFNTYSFTDFDYEERPGSDALLFRYYYSLESSMEIAAKAAGNWEEFIGALKWNHKIGRYDLQWISGYFTENFVFGNGWAGHIGDFGFKGEWSWFYDLSDRDQNGFVLATSLDYSFQSGLYKQFGALFNKLGSNEFDTAIFLFEDVSPKNIYPYKWVIFDQMAYNFTPLWSISYFLLYSPSGSHGLFLQSSVNYNVATNWDMSFFSQVWFEKSESFHSPFQGFYLRIKWSY